MKLRELLGVKLRLSLLSEQDIIIETVLSILTPLFYNGQLSGPYFLIIVFVGGRFVVTIKYKMNIVRKVIQ